MSDVRDYLELRGDITLAERPFNDVDNLVMACLSYLDLRGIAPAPGERPITVGEACRALLAKAEGDLAPYVMSLASIDCRFVEALGVSERFGGLALRDYVDVFDGERVLQFAALTADLPDGTSVVSFRGTDSSLLGWREDFMLSFTVMESQRSSLAYLTRELERASAERRQVYVCGHSKGGVLATYASVSVAEALRDCIAHVWSDDGPCMDAAVVPTRPQEVFGERLTHAIPAYDVVGLLFDDGRPRTIVCSDADGAMQHDPMSWQVGPTGFVRADEIDPDAARLDEAIRTWVSEIPMDERQRFCDELFDVLEAGGANTLEELMGSVGGVQKVFSALANADQRTRDLVGKLLGNVVGSQVDAARERVSDVAAEAAVAMTDAATQAANAAAEAASKGLAALLDRAQARLGDAGEGAWGGDDEGDGFGNKGGSVGMVLSSNSPCTVSIMASSSVDRVRFHA